jgi:DNA transformation protein and related proteins
MSSKSVRELSNIGPKTATWLESIGVKTLEDIEKLGAIEVYERLKLAYPEQVSLNALWALQGAILDMPWNQLPESVKEDLKRQLQMGVLDEGN